MADNGTWSDADRFRVLAAGTIATVIGTAVVVSLLLLSFRILELLHPHPRFEWLLYLDYGFIFLVFGSAYFVALPPILRPIYVAVRQLGGEHWHSSSIQMDPENPTTALQRIRVLFRLYFVEIPKGGLILVASLAAIALAIFVVLGVVGLLLFGVRYLFDVVQHGFR